MVESGALRIRNIAKYFGSNSALDGIELTLVSGEVTVLMGVNGVGKSTLVTMICGVYCAGSGDMHPGGRHGWRNERPSPVKAGGAWMPVCRRAAQVAPWSDQRKL